MVKTTCKGFGKIKPTFRIIDKKTYTRVGKSKVFTFYLAMRISFFKKKSNY